MHFSLYLSSRLRTRQRIWPMRHFYPSCATCRFNGSFKVNGCDDFVGVLPSCRASQTVARTTHWFDVHGLVVVSVIVELGPESALLTHEGTGAAVVAGSRVFWHGFPI